MTEEAAEWLGTGSGQMELISLNRRSFLRNVEADIANAFGWITPSAEARRLAEKVLSDAQRCVQTSNIFSRDNFEHEAAKEVFQRSMEELRLEVVKCPAGGIGNTL